MGREQLVDGKENRVAPWVTASRRAVADQAEMHILHLGVSILQPLSTTSANKHPLCSTGPAYDYLLPHGFDGGALK